MARHTDIIGTIAVGFTAACVFALITVNPLLVRAADVLRAHLVPQEDAIPPQVDFPPRTSGPG